MKFDAKFEKKLKSLIDKYGKKGIDSISDSDDDLDIIDDCEKELDDGTPSANSVEEIETDGVFNPDVSNPPASNPIVPQPISISDDSIIDDPLISDHYFTYKKVTKDDDQFLEDFYDGKKYEHHYILSFHDIRFVHTLQKVCEQTELYDTNPFLDVVQLFHCINNFRIACETKYGEESDEPLTPKELKQVKLIRDFTEELYQDEISKMDRMIESGSINYSSLWYYFDKVGTIYVVRHHDENICFRHKSFSYSKTDEIDEFDLNGEIITWYDIRDDYKDGNKDSLHIGSYVHTIKKFKELKKISDINVKVLKDTDKHIYLENGNKFTGLFNKIEHMYFEGKQYFRRELETLYIDRHESVMVDNKGLTKYSTSKPYNFFMGRNIEIDEMTDMDKMIVFPFIGIYNLGIDKIWGVGHISYLKENIYDSNAFDYLVLEKEKKDLIQALIKNHGENKAVDFIRGKGEGIVFLLHGMSGLGKTLTAEATCAYLKRPLYKLNVGDLGINPESIERVVNTTLDLTKRWKAIMLIDEVDMFVETRDTPDINRNAMVGVFLKLLEYHNGIIFLTTNRLDSIDPAIKDRINILLAYKPFETKERYSIWRGLFSKWNLEIDDESINELAKEKLNGREIRNYMKIVFSIATEKKITGKVILETLKKCTKLQDEFTRGLKKPPEHMFT